MSFIADALGSAVTGQGTNAAQGLQDLQQNAGKTVASSYGTLLPGAQSLAQGSVAYANQLQPYYQEAMNRGIYSNTTQDALANAQAANNGVYSNAAMAARQAALGLTAQGAGSGAVGGATAALYGNAANQANQNIDSVYAPAAVQQRLMQRLSLLGGAETPDISTLQKVGSGETSALFGTPAPHIQANPLAAALGTAAQMGVSSLFSGGKKSAAPAPASS